jgi:sulfite exporter TauE/SafE
MSEGVLVSMFLLGLFSSFHCFGMCGGVVTALTVGLPADQPRAPLQLSYHAGRLATYAAAGALAGALGSAAMLMRDFVPEQRVLYVAAQLMMIALGLYLVGINRFVAPFERAGAVLWRRVQPWTGKFMPVRSMPRAWAVGMLWGLLPCGLVYSVLATSLVSGSAYHGAGVMIAFGAGTLPGLLSAGALVPVLQRFRRAELARRTAGVVVIVFGLLGLVHATQTHHLPGDAFFCVVGSD